MTKPPEDLRAVIFDLDGTLVDTADEFIVVVQALRAEHGHSDMSEDLIRSTVSNGARALVTLALGIQEEDPGFETLRLRLLDIYSEVIGSSARPYEGIEDLLAELDDRSIQWGIATNKPRAYTEPLLDRLAIKPAPGSVVCPDDVGERKPHPESLYLNCKQLGCAPHQAIYVGDHLRDIEAGRRAGMYTIAAAYGYIEAHDNPDTWNADITVNHSTELRSLILP
ncbi:MAG: HAD-IA family hydrolase [Halioglobus sp.]